MQLHEHVSCQYSEESVGPQAPLDGSLSLEDDTVIRWICPKCGGITAKRAVTVGPGKGIIGRQKKESEELAGLSSSPFTVTCDCGQRHPGRPPSARYRGCGASWFERPAGESAP